MGTQRFARHRAKALAFVVAAFGLAAAGSANAGVWDASAGGGLSCGTSGCHTLPPAIAPSTPDGVATPVFTCGGNTIGLSESWMSSSSALKTRANSALCASGSMASLTDSDALLVWNYFRQVRDGVVGNQVGTPTFASAAIGVQSSTSNSFSFNITNYRGTALNYSLSTTGTNAGDFSVNLTGVSGAGCTTSQLPATGSTSGSTCTVTVTVTFQPTNGTAGTRSAAVRVTLTDPVAGVAPVTGADKTLATFTATATTPTPGFQLNTASIAFGSLQVGTTSAATTVTITNPSSATANLVLGALSAASFSGTNPGDFAVSAGATNSCTLGGTTLVPNSSCNIRVSFTPGGKGGRSGTLTIQNNAGAAGTVTLSGTGLQGTISLGSATVAVGNVNQGSSGTATLAVNNTGDWPITFSSFPVSGTGSGEFAASGCASPLANGNTCTLTITFTPTNTTPRSVTLTVNGNASNAPTATLTGTGVALANPSLSATTATFPSTLVTVTSATTRTITITNPRANALTVVRSFSGTNASDFAVSGGTCAGTPFSIAGGGSCTLVLSFTPAAGPGAGARSGSLDLSFTGFGTDPSPGPQSVALSGTAEVPTPVVGVPSTTISLAAVVGTPATATTTITNTGTGPLTLGTLTFGGTFASEFSLAGGNTCTAGQTIPITAGSNSCTLAVTFNPANASPTSRNGTLTVAHNAAGGSTTFTLAGTATPAPQPALDIGGISSLAFGSVPLGSTGQQTVTVLNNGAAPLAISAITLGGTNAADFTRGGTCSTAAAVAVSTSCTVVLTFAPAAAGARSAVLTITSNASNLPTATVTLAGSGVALADPVVTPATVDPFPTTLTATTSATTRVVTITNPRANTLTYARALSGAHAAEFGIAAESCPTRVVPAGGACTLTLQFSPVAAGTRTASLDLGFTGFNLDPSPPAQARALSGSAVLPSPTFSASTTAMTFAAVVGTPGTGTAVITNTGSAALALSDLSISGVAAADFSFATGNTCTAGTQLAPSANCTLAIRYAPAAAGTGSAALTVTHNATGSPSTITLSGTATPAPQGRIALSATSLSFATTQVGSASSQLVTVQNTGDLALTFSAFSISGTHAGDFVRGGTCATATPLAIAAQCTLLVSFQPTAAGARSAALTVQSDASNGAATIALSGTAVPAPAPVVTLSTALLDFGAQTVGGVYPARSVTLTNSGNADLTTVAVTVLGDGFANVSARACPAILAAGASCTVDIRFAPTAAGTDYTGSLRVTSNAAGSPHVTGLSGRGTAAVVPVLAWTPAVARLDFGQVEVGSVSATQSATVVNQGPGGVTLTLLNAVGPDGAAFSVSAGSCTVGQVLFEGQGCRIDVRFAPGAPGAKSATVQVASTGSAPAELVLAGSGLGGPSPALSLSATTLPFNGVRVGARSLPQDVTLSASGSGIVAVSAIAVSGPFTVQSKTCPATPFTLAAGSECVLTVTFAPVGEGAASGLLSVTNDAVPNLREVALSGSGETEVEATSGGCSIADGARATDPTLWALLLAAVAALVYRRRARRAEA